MFSSPRVNDLEHKVNRNLSMVKLFYQNRDYDTAKSYVNEALKLKPHSSEAYKLLSQIHEATGDNVLAMEYYKKALELRASSCDLNISSPESNRQFFTPTKSPNHFGGTPNNVSLASIVNNNNNSNNVSPQQLANTESIEKLLDGKITTLLSNFQSNVNEKISLLSGNVDKIVGDVSHIKKKLDDVQKKLSMLSSKQDEMNSKVTTFVAAQPKGSSNGGGGDAVKKQIDALSHSLGNLAGDNSKILIELSELKEAVLLLNEKGNFSDDYDEEEYNDENDDDYEDSSNHQRQSSSFSNNGLEKPKLGALTKKVDKDAWNCPTCDTPNSNSASACACCETVNPNQSASKANGPTVSTSQAAQFKFGTSSGSAAAFSFGVPAAAASTAAATLSPNSFSGLDSTNSNIAATTTTPAPIFGVSSKTTTPAAIFGVPSKTTTPAAIFGVSSNAAPIFGVSASANTCTAATATTNKNTTTASFSFNSALTNSSAVPTFGTFGSASSSALNSSPFSTMSSVFPSFGTAGEPSNAKPATTTTAGSVGESSSSLSALSSTFPTFGVASAAKPTSAEPQPFLGFSSSTFKFPTTFESSANNNNLAATSSLFKTPTSTTDKPQLLDALLSGTAPTNTFSFPLKASQTSSSNNKGSPDKATTVTSSTDDHEGEHHYVENDAENAQDGDYFKLPDVKLPEKYDQVTGEENEKVSFEKKAKLYIFKNGEYKERGVGILKILTDNETSKHRALMRRDHIFKVCLNARLADMTNFEIVDQKFLRFSCIDFSEDDKPTSGVFLLKFGNPDLLPVFKSLVESMSGKLSKTDTKRCEKDTSTAKKVDALSSEETTTSVDTSEVELVFVKEPKAEHLDTIKKLMLPPNFYDYEDKPNCLGCIGCNDDFNFSDLIQEAAEEPAKPKDDFVNKAETTSNSETTTVAGSGLFSSIATDLNLVQNKVDTIGSGEEAVDNEHMNDKNFVSEKSKLLPEKFEVKTGEEDEEVLFNERCKIYHYVNDEWKERGVGNMKVLKRKDSNVFRMLMRRDKIYNVVCNQGIAKGLNLKPFPNSNNTLSWAARDYSDEAAGQDKLFALRFKTEALVKQFEKTINDCIDKVANQ